MRVAALMSGTGSNLEKILERQGKYRVVCILTDNPRSFARRIAQKNGIPFEENDIDEFYESKGKQKSDLTLRAEFDRLSVLKLTRHKPDVLAYCGYMRIASPQLVDAYLGVNVHPADLSAKNRQGSRKFVGAHAVRDALLSGEKTLRSTTHLVENTVDGGRILMRSHGIPVTIQKGLDLKKPDHLNKVIGEYQQRLKEQGDWLIFPETLDALAEKRFTQDEEGNIHFDGKPVPNGILFGRKDSG